MAEAFCLVLFDCSTTVQHRTSTSNGLKPMFLFQPLYLTQSGLRFRHTWVQFHRAVNKVFTVLNM